MVSHIKLRVIIGLAPAALCSVMHLSSLTFKHNVATEGKVRSEIGIPDGEILRTTRILFQLKQEFIESAKMFLIDEAEDFTKKHPEETKKRLGVIVEKMDGDRNGLVTVLELTTWIDFIHKDHIRRDVEREWKVRNPDQVSPLPWTM